MADRLTSASGKGFLYPCPGCMVNRAADEGHHLCRECEGYEPAPTKAEIIKPHGYADTTRIVDEWCDDLPGIDISYPERKALVDALTAARSGRNVEA